MKIYKSCTAGITDEQFKNLYCSGTTTFVSFERLMRTSITEAIGLKQKESIKGVVIDAYGITFYLEIVPIGTANHNFVK